MPLAGREVRVPETQRPEEDGDQVLDPRVERRCVGRYRRHMRCCSVGEDSNQNVDHDKDSGGAEQSLQKVRHQLTSAHGGTTPLYNVPRYLHRNTRRHARELWTLTSARLGGKPWVQGVLPLSLICMRGEGSHAECPPAHRAAPLAVPVLRSHDACQRTGGVLAAGRLHFSAFPEVRLETECRFRYGALQRSNSSPSCGPGMQAMLPGQRPLTIGHVRWIGRTRSGRSLGMAGTN